MYFTTTLVLTLVLTYLGNSSAKVRLVAREDYSPLDRISSDEFVDKSGSEIGSMPLDGRALLNSWMGKRQRTCNDAGYSPCPSMPLPPITTANDSAPLMSYRQHLLLSHRRYLLHICLLRRRRVVLWTRQMRRPRRDLLLSWRLQCRRRLLWSEPLQVKSK